MAREQDNSLWRIWVDTGGTFTDCIGVDPAGGVHRAKVLSSSRLRGRCITVESDTVLSVREHWDAPAGFIEGLELRGLGWAAGATVLRYLPGPGEGVIELATPLPRPMSPGDAFEIVSGEEAPILAARLVTQTPAAATLPPIAMRLATTRGTNALLEGKGADVALFITRGFADLLSIGTQQRPEIFALEIRKPRPIERMVIEVDERMGVDGQVLRELDLAGIDEGIDRALAAGIRSCAVVLLHSWINPDHELRLAEHLRQRGFSHISVSSELAAQIRVLPRGQTAVVNAALAPILDAYLGGVVRPLQAGGDGSRSRLHIMTSAGGLVQAGRVGRGEVGGGAGGFRPKDGLLSGPAGGVVGAAAAGRASGFSRLITFDMGGTSTDVARFDGDHAYDFEHRVGDAHILAPAVAVHSVAAGGGSLCWFDRAERLLRVGPHSAGADPGPACYGAGGPLTITDVNLLLGRLDPSRFQIPVDVSAARARAVELAAEVAQWTASAAPIEELLEGLIDLADERMAQAIREISVQRGEDPAQHVLVAFGGAGGQHACGVAQRLGIRTVLVPADVGLLSAVGLGAAALERFAERQILRRLEDVTGELKGVVEELGRKAAEEVVAQGAPAAQVRIRRTLVSLRLVGQESWLDVELEPTGAPEAPVREAFTRRYVEVYGYPPPAGRDIEVVSMRVVASTGGGERLPPPATPPTPPGHRPSGEIRARFRGQWMQANVQERGELSLGQEVHGPALILEDSGTTVVQPGWVAAVDDAAGLVLRREARQKTAPGEAAQTRGFTRGTSLIPGVSGPGAVRDAVLAGRLTAIATEMGHTLQRTALSTNVKERLDFSCAILDSHGELVVNAPHIPVHLGALGPCVRALREAVEMGPGDVVVTNHPAFGGSHLPDVTVVTPVHDSEGTLLGYTASRAHHAEIGGVAPGSMPPSARTLAEEGVVIPPMHLVRAGVHQSEPVRRLLTLAPYPSRAADENMADLSAQAAANQRGAAALVDLARQIGSAGLAAAMTGLMQRAEARLREALASLGDRTLQARQELDDGSPICVQISTADGKAAIDFSGSAGVHPGNFNAPAGVVRSAVIYVLRLLIREPLPLNEGLMRAVDLHIPEGMLSPPLPADPHRCPAVAAGNVETSQRVVDALLKALELAAASQGTMNNIIFGNQRFGCYETVCGGAGAGPGFNGADAVHTHMTNTRITDPEVMERRYPVRVERFAIRRGSGGRGRHRGGDGVVRELLFLEPVSLSLLTQRRRPGHGPYGLAGGEPGQPGSQHLVRAAGAVVPLNSVASIQAMRGDRLVLETPGGGGYGTPGMP